MMNFMVTLPRVESKVMKGERVVRKWRKQWLLTIPWWKIHPRFLDLSSDFSHGGVDSPVQSFTHLKQAVS